MTKTVHQLVALGTACSSRDVINRISKLDEATIADGLSEILSQGNAEAVRFAYLVIDLAAPTRKFLAAFNQHLASSTRFQRHNGVYWVIGNSLARRSSDPRIQRYIKGIFSATDPLPQQLAVAYYYLETAPLIVSPKAFIAHADRLREKEFDSFSVALNVHLKDKRIRRELMKGGKTVVHAPAPVIDALSEHTDDEEITEFLYRAAVHGNLDQRMAAFRALSQGMVSERLRRYLITAICLAKDTDTLETVEMIELLSRGPELSSDEFSVLIRKAQTCNDPIVLRALYKVLGKKGPAQMRLELNLELTMHSDKHIRLGALERLEQEQIEQMIITPLFKLLHDDETSVKLAAIDIVAKHTDYVRVRQELADAVAADCIDPIIAALTKHANDPAVCRTLLKVFRLAGEKSQLAIVDEFRANTVSPGDRFEMLVQALNSEHTKVRELAQSWTRSLISDKQYWPYFLDELARTESKASTSIARLIAEKDNRWHKALAAVRHRREPAARQTRAVRITK